MRRILDVTDSPTASHDHVEMGPRIRISSASWRNLPAADLYLDCRAVPHPPKDVKPAQWLACHANEWVERYADLIMASLDTLPARRPSGIATYHVCCVCAEGRYRSRGMASLLTRWLERWSR